MSVPDEGYSRLSNLLIMSVPNDGYSRLSNLLIMSVPDDSGTLIIKRWESLE
jgi:hypothetical protein